MKIRFLAYFPFLRLYCSMKAIWRPLRIDKLIRLRFLGSTKIIPNMTNLIAAPKTNLALSSSKFDGELSVQANKPRKGAHNYERSTPILSLSHSLYTYQAIFGASVVNMIGSYCSE